MKSSSTKTKILSWESIFKQFLLSLHQNRLIALGLKHHTLGALDKHCTIISCTLKQTFFWEQQRGFDEVFCVRRALWMYLIPGASLEESLKSKGAILFVFPCLCEPNNLVRK